MRRFSPLLSVALVAASAIPALALPPTPELNDWKDSNNNCYDYALNQHDDDFKQPGGGGTWPYNPDPLTAAEWCEKVVGRAVGDGLVQAAWNPGDPIPTPPAGSNLVALAAFGGFKFERVFGGDYHWYRLNGDGTWSQKHGKAPATDKYYDDRGLEHTFTDPRDINQREGYDEFCGFFYKAKSLDVQPDTTGFKQGVLAGVRWFAMTHSGAPDEKHTIVNQGIDEAQSRLPTQSPGNQVPDPQWHFPGPGACAGYMVVPSEDLTQFPPRMRVWNGVVAVYSDPAGTQITYYHDDHALEAFLAAQLTPVPATSPPWLGAAIAALLATGLAAIARRRREPA